MKCKKCDKDIEGDKRKVFCDRSCSASFNNMGIRRHGNAAIDCKNCGKKHNNLVYCSHKCQHIKQKQLQYEEFEKTGVWPANNPIARQAAIRKYLLSTRELRCDICNLAQWRDQPIPLVMDHIDGNADNNRINNLRLICGNCDMQQPTYCARNRGKGRKYRRDQYIKVGN